LQIFEPADSWSVQNLLEEHGETPIADFHAAYPTLSSTRYDEAALDLDQALDGVDLVIVHEWSSHALVKRIGEHRARTGSYRLLFHDTHHRAVTERQQMAAYDLSHYDGVLAYGEVLRQVYLKEGWSSQVWTWHEAADTRVFHPIEGVKPTRDLVWIGNWGDDERTVELHEFLIRPVKALHLDATVYGVRYPEAGKKSLTDACIEYGGWLPNYRAPEVFAQYRVTVHVPRLPYVRQLPGIPTIRPFEALACGIPLISAPWNDAEGLFTPGRDFLVAKNEKEMQRQLKAVLADKAMARELAVHGRKTILERHTCAHRVNELEQICTESASQRAHQAPPPHPGHPERSGGGKAGGAQSKDPVALQQRLA
jgi:spore maturation protein CgeB